MAEFIDIQRKLVANILKIPTMINFATRNTLLDGLPPAPLVRSADDPRTDLNNMIGGLQRLGRLTDRGGTRPLIVLVDNALLYVPEGGEVAAELAAARQALVTHYGGDRQPVAALPQQVKEALIFGLQRDNRLPFDFLEGAMQAAQAVARLFVPRIVNGAIQKGKGGWGTGWLIAPGMVITNHHVIEARDYESEGPATPQDFRAQAEALVARFDYRYEAQAEVVECRHATLLASDPELDYAVLELAEAPKVENRQPLRLTPTQPKLERGARLNIVQHPQGGPLQLAIRNNFYVQPGEHPAFLRYQTDTEPGASGSPVCNDAWQVVGLHHASVEAPPQQVPQEVLEGKPVTVQMLNEAIAIHSVLSHLPPEVRQRIRAAQEMT
jgi:V8-like Glu-specific endopeptidase